MATAASPLLHSEDLDVLPLDPRYTHPVKAATLAADGPLLERIYSDHEDIDWIGRWDASKTARWAGASLRFRFNGPLLFLIPGEKTIATDSPMIGWQIDGGGKTYTSHARKGRSIRLWPPEGVAHPALPITPGLDDDDDNLKSTQGTRSGLGGNNAKQTTSTTSTSTDTTSTPTRPTLTGSRQSTSTNLNLSLSTGLHVNDDHQEVGPDEPTPRASTFAESQLQPRPASSSTSRSLSSSTSPISNSHLIEITLIDWGSTFQVNHFEMLAGSKISPAYQIGKSNLPTLLFIGDSTTCGYLPDEPISHSRPQFRSKNSRRREGGGGGGTDHRQDDDANQDGYSGFLDAFPSHLKSYLAPGIRIYSIAFPGISLVDDSNNLSTGGSSSSGAEENGMESKFFKIGPLEPEGIEEEDNEWTFEDREDGNAPTHIFVNLGANDVIDTERDVEKFLETLENFLGLLKETYGRRTGDILVMSPFGQYQEQQHVVETQESIERPSASAKLSTAAIIPSNHQASQSTTKEGGSSSSSYTSPLTSHIKNKIEELSEKWRLESEDPLASGQFPDTPILEYTKSQLDQEIPLSPRSPSSSSSFVPTSKSNGSSRPNSASFTSGILQMQQQQDNPPSVSGSASIPSINMIKSTSMTSIASTSTTTTAATRPALIVRPSSIAAAVAPTEEKGTTTKLHFIDTSGWLDSKEDTFEDGLHPTSKGARKIAKKLKKWLGQNGFLATQSSS